jgi:hypothetical protein
VESPSGVVGTRRGNGGPQGWTDVRSLTVRELVVELARTEEELRGLRDPARVCAPGEDLAERRVETLAAQGRIVRELRHRRRSRWLSHRQTGPTTTAP